MWLTDGFLVTFWKVEGSSAHTYESDTAPVHGN